MKKIDSFSVDHNKLERGIYLSRRDILQGVVIDTWDIRVKEPNNSMGGGFLSAKVAHTIEHIGATLLRNRYKDKIVYFGPMGCGTGFYLLTHSMSTKDIEKAVRDTFQAIVDWSGPIPGASRKECGNYTMHSLQAAKIQACKFLSINPTVNQYKK